MNILLVCAAGMSTSLLVTKMEKSAQEQGKEYKIWAVSGDSVNQHIDKADVLLLGPQVRYLLPQLKNWVNQKECRLKSSIPSITALATERRF